MNTIQLTENWTLITSSISLIQFDGYGEASVYLGSVPDDDTLNYFTFVPKQFFSNNAPTAVYARTFSRSRMKAVVYE